MTGSVGHLDEPALDGHGRWPIYFSRAVVHDLEIWLNDAHLVVEWSEFDRCHFRQRVRPVVNEFGFSAQGSFANGPAIYRDCTFERVRFKVLGGFTMGQARFENCSFVNCRWEGHFAFEADLIDCTFVGKMNGCVWNGRSLPGPDGERRRNDIRGNDFSRTVFTTNVAWRTAFPLQDQRFPEGFRPVVDDWKEEFKRGR